MKLVIKNLTKTYKNGVKAIDNLSIEIGTGMFGLLGPNGAGKSSLMRTIATLQSPDSGSITFGDIQVLDDNMSLRKVFWCISKNVCGGIVRLFCNLERNFK
jgi:ABC-type multidrug transport system ATPase subunit